MWYLQGRWLTPYFRRLQIPSKWRPEMFGVVCSSIDETDMQTEEPHREKLQREDN